MDKIHQNFHPKTKFPISILHWSL